MPAEDKKNDQEEIDKEVERWKVKQLIKHLEAARGSGTSMISLMLTPKDQIARMVNMLNNEHGTASSIKSHTTKLAVQGAITSVLQRLKLYNRVPTNGLVVYCGTVMTEGTKTKKLTFDFEPFRPVPQTMYMCDNKFHTQPLRAMLESDERYGFIIMDGNGTLFGAISGNTREVLYKFTVDLPKKHRKGGQSAARFGRLRLEKRAAYVSKVTELATHCFISQDKPNIAGLVLGGHAEFKKDLAKSQFFDGRLMPLILTTVDIAYGGEVGFNQAIELAGETLGGVKFVHEKKLLAKYFDEIAQDSNMYVYGLQDSIKALEMGALKTVILWEELDALRHAITNPTTKETSVIFLTQKQTETEQHHFKDPTAGAALEVETELVTEWLAEKYREFGCVIEFVTDCSSEGNQFVRGFAGIGGFLRYQVDFVQLAEAEENAKLHEIKNLKDIDFDNFDEDAFL